MKIQIFQSLLYVCNLACSLSANGISNRTENNAKAEMHAWGYFKETSQSQ